MQTKIKALCEDFKRYVLRFQVVTVNIWGKEPTYLLYSLKFNNPFNRSDDINPQMVCGMYHILTGDWVFEKFT